MNVGKLAVVVISAALMAWPGCASQRSELERESTPPVVRAPGPSAMQVRADGNASLEASDIDTVRRFLCGRARAQLVLLESELTRVARRLGHEGSDAQRKEWIPVLVDIEHDRGVLAEGLIEAETAPLEEWAEVHGILPSLIDVLTFVGAQTVTAIDEALDTPAAGPQESSGKPHGA